MPFLSGGWVLIREEITSGFSAISKPFGTAIGDNNVALMTQPNGYDFRCTFGAINSENKMTLDESQ